MIAGVWGIFFGWPGGGIWSNILASILWTAPMWGLLAWRHRIHLRRELAAVHAHLAAAHEKLDAIHEHVKPDDPLQPKPRRVA